MKIGLMAGAALAALFAASGASAQLAEPGWYGAVDLGYHFPLDRNYKSDGVAPDGQYYNWRLNPKDDWAGFVRLGYRFNPHWRLELEGGYRNDSFGKIHATDGSRVANGEPDGLISNSKTGRTYTGMANVIYDILPSDSTWVPFIGGGVGFNHTNLKVNGVFDAPVDEGGTPQTLRLAAADTELAYQGLAGIAYKFSDRLNVDLTYRFIGSNALKYHSDNSTPGLATDEGYRPGTFQAHYTDSSVTIGLRYAFASPPPPAAAPAPAASSAPASSAPAAASPAAPASGVRGQGIRGLLPVRSVRADAGSPDRGATGGPVRQ